ncbi:MAG: protein kinase [Gemmatimonadota bacterium]|nr:protein kinase [Gemmatimonadota bacterium]
MSALLERLRRALGPEYEVEQELASGGMGIVYVGRDPALDRAVAIKLLRPELATAAAAERFLREAQTLASVSHPNVVTIYKVGDPTRSDGLHYFVMELFGRSLGEQLQQGSMPPREVVRLGRALLEGLAKVHAKGVVHRDIKPSNIFLRDDAPVLGDFGIAKRRTASDPTLTQPGHSPGTPAYMAPEQLASGDVSAAADVYAVGMVLYEALKGKRWEGIGDPADADWRGIPTPLTRVLQRALALEPQRRWPDAASFAAALRATRRPSLVPVLTVGGATATALAVFVGINVFGNRGGSVTSDVAVLPFATAGVDPGVGEDLAKATEIHLENAFRVDTLRVTPFEQAAQWWGSMGRIDSLPPEAWSTLRTTNVARGEIRRRGDSLEIRLEVADARRRPRPVALVTTALRDSATLGNLGYQLAAAIVRAVRPGRDADFVGYPKLAGGNAAAVEAMLAGHRAFARENWIAAESLYAQAVRLEPTLGQAWWGLYNVRRWRRVPYGFELATVYAQYPEDFPVLDALLIRGDLGVGPERLVAYRDAIRAFPFNAEPWLLLGNELFHRGALAGVPRDSAIRILDSAIVRNPSLAPAYSTLAWALIRRGDSAASQRALQRYGAVAYPTTERELCLACLLDLVWKERFAPEQAALERSQIISAPGGAASLARMLRLGLSFGVPRAQLDYGIALAALAPDAGSRADALIGQGLALVAVGQVEAALRRFDSAATLSGDPQFVLQARQWRLLLPALGVPGVLDAERERSRTALATTPAALRMRAQWTLALDALARGDEAALSAARAGLGGDDTTVTRLRTLVDALVLAARDSLRAALARADELLVPAYHAMLGDPFARAVLYLGRGDWLRRLDDAGADAAWLWYENASFEDGWPAGPARTGEIDWALETWGRYRRGTLALAHRDERAACAFLPEVARRWRDADPAYGAAWREATDAAATCARENR